MNELAKVLKDETQITRGIWNYLLETFKGVKGHTFDFDEYTVTDRIEFYEFVEDALKTMIHLDKQYKEDSPEEYNAEDGN